MKRLLLLIGIIGVGCQTVQEEGNENLRAHLPDGEQHSYLESQLEKLENLADRYPKVSRHHFDIAAIQFQQENYHDSASALQQAILLSEEAPNPEYHYHLGRVYLQMRELHLAEEQFRKSVKHTRKERYSGPRASLAYVLALKKEVPEAIEHFKRCLKIDKKNAEFYYFLGALYDMQQNDERAIHYFREYLERGGTRYRNRSIDLLGKLGVIVEMKIDDFDQAPLQENQKRELVPGVPFPEIDQR